MITVTVYKTSEDHYRGLKLLGHAGYAKHGSDIICAAVSALTVNTVNAIEKYTDDRIIIKTNALSGLLAFKFIGKASERSILLVDSLILGLQEIQNDNCSKEYIKIIFKEV